MRQELVVIGQIENYLLGNLSDEEKVAFEEKAKYDGELKSLIEQQKALMKGIQMNLYRNAAKKAWMRRRLHKFLAWGAVGIVAISAAIYFWPEAAQEEVRVYEINKSLLEDKYEVVSVIDTPMAEEKEVIEPPVIEKAKPKEVVEKPKPAVKAIPTVVKEKPVVKEKKVSKVESVSEKIETVEAFDECELCDSEPTIQREKLTAPVEVYKVSAEKNTTVRLTSSNSIMYVPAHAFVDKNGNPIKKQVELKVREYRDQASMALSDIPMVYYENHKEFIFDSYGMFELRASADGSDVHLAEGKAIEIDYEMTGYKEGINFYQLNEENRSWVLTKERGSVVDAKDVMVTSTPKRGRLQKLENIGPEDTIVYEGKSKIKVSKREWERMKQVNRTRAELIRTLRITKMGIYNCDRQMKFKNPVVVHAQFVTEQGKSITDWEGCYHIDKGINSVYSQYSNKIRMSATGKNMILLLTPNNVLYGINETEFAKLDIINGGKVTVPLEVLSEKANSLEKLREYIQQ